MDWVKLATRFYADPAVASLPDADTELMFVRGLARAGEECAGGFIPESALGMLARRRRYASCVDALVAAGLWTRVDGGYQITRWSDWQAELDALSRRRAADRVRQRKRRAADESSVSRDTVPQSSPSRDTQSWQSLSRDIGSVPLPSRDIGGLSRDAQDHVRRQSADCHGHERERERENRGGLVGQSPTEDQQPEPPRTCPQHHDNPDPPPCGQCADARRTWQQWRRDTDRRVSAQAQQRAAERAAAIRSCDQCDDHGQLAGGWPCGHTVTAAQKRQPCDLHGRRFCVACHVTEEGEEAA